MAKFWAMATIIEMVDMADLIFLAIAGTALYGNFPGDMWVRLIIDELKIFKRKVKYTLYVGIDFHRW